MRLDWRRERPPPRPSRRANVARTWPQPPRQPSSGQGRGGKAGAEAPGHAGGGDPQERDNRTEAGPRGEEAESARLLEPEQRQKQGGRAWWRPTDGGAVGWPAAQGRGPVGRRPFEERRGQLP